MALLFRYHIHLDRLSLLVTNLEEYYPVIGRGSSVLISLVVHVLVGA